MSYILSAQRDHEPYNVFERYDAYLRENRERFPPGAYALATSDWYFAFDDLRGPHDAWLEEVAVTERGRGERSEIRGLEIRIRLLNACHNGYIELRYRDVVRYRLGLWDKEIRDNQSSHGDWRYDEFRLSDEGRLLHEIEWWGMLPNSTWLIEAGDVEHTFIPMDHAPRGTFKANLYPDLDPVTGKLLNP